MTNAKKKSVIRNNAPSLVSIEANPFAILGLSVRDDRKKILEAAEEKSLVVDPEICSKARVDLTNPRNRLKIEISWLPGVSPKKANDLVKAVRKNPDSLGDDLKIESLAHANLIISVIELLDENSGVSVWSDWIKRLALATERFDAEKLLQLVNEDRAISGFTEVKSLDQVDKEIADQKTFYKDKIKGELDRLPSDNLVKLITKIVSDMTNNGKSHAPTLIDDLLDSYSLEVQQTLSDGKDKIEKLISHISASTMAGESKITPLIDTLEKALQDWDILAQPIQVSLQSRGVQHDISLELGRAVRSLSIELANDKNFYNTAQRLSVILKEVFAELPDFTAHVEEDIETLNDLSEKHAHKETLSPITSYCISTLESAEKQPIQAQTLAISFISEVKWKLDNLQKQNVPISVMNDAGNMVAFTLMRVAIIYGNQTNKWAECKKFLELALQYAKANEVIEKIKKNIDTAAENASINNNLEPITSAPSLSTINGIGMKLYGCTDREPVHGSYMSTYYFVVLFIPVFPVCRYRVISDGNSYRFLGKGKLRTFDKWHLAISVLLILIMFGNM